MNSLIFSICFIILIAGLSSYFTINNTNTTLYNCLKTDLTPPNYVFPIVWNILYLLIIYALYLILKYEHNFVKFFIFINLFLNIIWCYLYFEKKQLLNAFIVILIMKTTLFTTILLSKNNTVKLLLIPYLLWLSFASLLNLVSLRNLQKCL
jgi:benzodiazapine receptor